MGRRALFFLSPNVGGAERVSVRIGTALPRDRYDVGFVVCGRDYGNISGFIPDWCPVTLLRLRRSYDFTIARMVSLIRREKPDVVFCSLRYLNVRLIAAARLCGVKVIVRNDNSVADMSRVTKVLAHMTYRFSDVVICQQDEMAAEYSSVFGLSPERVVTLANPLDTALVGTLAAADSPFDAPADRTGSAASANPDRADGRPRFVCVARFDVTKGQDVLAKAFSIVHGRLPDAHMYFVGDMSSSPEFSAGVRSYVHSEGLDGFVHFAGYDANPYRWMAGCDCYVMPSRLEGLPNSLVEAMWLGRPVVATSCVPVVARMVDNERNGFVVPSENPESMADAMVRALSLTDLRMSYVPSSTDDFVAIFDALAI